jgi:uncharacterized protein
VLSPVAPRERLATLDVLRGFALLGVLLGNLYMLYTFRWAAEGEAMDTGDEIAEWFMRLVVEGRAQTLLTLLFGFGFAAQLLRAEDRGERVMPVYLRRIAALFLIGWCHVLFLWWGDVTWGYAVTALPLLLFLRTSNRTRVVTAVAITLIPAAIYATWPIWPWLHGQLFARDFKAYVQDFLAAAAGTDRVEILRQNATMALVWIGGSLGSYPLWLLGRFLLGYVAGAQRWFERDGADRLAMFRRMAVIGALATVPYFAFVALAVADVFKLGKHGPASQAVATILDQICVLGQVACYVGIVVVLMQRPAWRRILMIVSPVGRMPLTTYLLQSLICTSLFYGWGLHWGMPGKAATVGLAFAIFTVQVAISHLWLRWFRFGPAEWVWRTLVYLQLPRMRVER